MRIGVRQYVSICGGLEPCCIAEDIAGDRLRVYEIERASAAREKRERLKNAGIPAPGHCTVAEADFPYDDPAAALEGTGFDRNKKTVFAVPGFFGIEREEALTLLRSLYETAAPGSSLIFDFVLPGAPESVPDTGGIPVRQRLSPEQTEQMLNDAGWSVYDLSEGIQIGREYVEPSRLPIRIPPFLGLVNAVRFR